MRADPGALIIRRWNREGIAEPYRGFDGEAIWPDELVLTVQRRDGLAEIDAWRQLDAIAREHRAVFPYDALIVARPPSTIVAPAGVEFFGYDFGWYDDEYSRFSSIRHEAMGAYPELRHNSFNNFGLLATPTDVAAYAATREALRRDGRGVEQAGGEQYAIMVFGAVTPTSPRP